MKLFLSFLLCLLLSIGFVSPAFAHDETPSSQEFIKAKVIKIESDGIKTVGGVKNRYQKISVQLLDGKDKGKTVTIESGLQTTLTPSQIVTKDQTIIVTKLHIPNQKDQYQVYDTYRISSLLYLFLAFLLVIIIIAGWKGFGSLVGLGISLVIIFMYIVPQILSGADPMQISIYGSLAILLLTTYLAHGISKQTTVALFSTFIALMLTAWLSSLFVNVVHLTGFNEETSTLQFGLTHAINLKGLLLGGIIIGTLGALNDITTTQAASVFELAKTDVRLTFKQLFSKGFAIGREHVVSMVNTLVLAYAGSSLALFLFLILNPQKLPFWVMINTEDISDEIVRTLGGSIGLVLVVPIVTLIAALVCDQEFRRATREILKSLK